MEDQYIHRSSRAGKILGGLFVIAAGVLYGLKKMGYFFPDWVFTWEMLLIAIGFFIILRSGFRNFSGLIIMGVGGAFLYQNHFPHVTSITPFIWPGVIILIGVLIVFSPHHNQWGHQRYSRRQRKYYSKEDWEKYKEDWSKYKEDWKKYKHEWRQYDAVNPQPMTSSDDAIDIVSIFGSTHRVIVSKNFRGGEMVNIFGGTELNLSQADINGTVYIDATQIFGGGKIIIPPNWEFRSEVANIFGGIEDKRPRERTIANPDKILVVTGATIFGGLEIVSY